MSLTFKNPAFQTILLQTLRQTLGLGEQAEWPDTAQGLVTAINNDIGAPTLGEYQENLEQALDEYKPQTAAGWFSGARDDNAKIAEVTKAITEQFKVLVEKEPMIFANNPQEHDDALRQGYEKIERPVFNTYEQRLYKEGERQERLELKFQQATDRYLYSCYLLQRQMTASGNRFGHTMLDMMAKGYRDTRRERAEILGEEALDEKLDFAEDNNTRAMQAQWRRQRMERSRERTKADRQLKQEDAAIDRAIYRQNQTKFAYLNNLVSAEKNPQRRKELIKQRHQLLSIRQRTRNGEHYPRTEHSFDSYLYPNQEVEYPDVAKHEDDPTFLEYQSWSGVDDDMCFSDSDRDTAHDDGIFALSDDDGLDNNQTWAQRVGSKVADDDDDNKSRVRFKF